VIRHWDGELSNYSFFLLAGARYFSLLWNFSNQVWNTLSCLPGVFGGLKWLGSEADRLIATGIENRNVWSYTSAPPYAFMASMRAPLPLC
jgi:hypothetical protein